MFLAGFDAFAIGRAVFPFVGLLVALVVFHEFGHFLAAKAFGIKVLEFGIGFPPRVKGLVWRKGETEYTINWLPIGGFVRMVGEEDPSDPRSLAAAPRWQRLTVMFAGVFMNIVLAIILFSVGRSPAKCTSSSANDSAMNRFMATPAFISFDPRP